MENIKEDIELLLQRKLKSRRLRPEEEEASNTCWGHKKRVSLHWRFSIPLKLLVWTGLDIVDDEWTGLGEFLRVPHSHNMSTRAQFLWLRPVVEFCRGGNSAFLCVGI